MRSREGRYLLHTNLSADDPELIWRCYMQLCFVEEAFRTLKGNLGLRPIFHQKPERIEAHLFVAFLAYCLSITLRQKLRGLACGLRPCVVLEKLATIQMLDVCVPMLNGRELLLVRHNEPSTEVALLLEHLNLTLKLRTPAPHCVAVIGFHHRSISPNSVATSSGCLPAELVCSIRLKVEKHQLGGYRRLQQIGRDYDVFVVGHSLEDVGRTIDTRNDQPPSSISAPSPQ